MPPVNHLIARSLIKDLYHSTEEPKVKKQLALSIVNAIKSQNPPGRFLESNSADNWFLVSDKRAIAKTAQALRERTRPPKCKRGRRRSAENTAQPRMPDLSAGEDHGAIDKQQQLKPQQSCSHGPCIPSLDISAIFNIDASQIGQFSDRDVEEWIKSVFAADNDAQTLDYLSPSAPSQNDAANQSLDEASTQVARFMGKWNALVPDKHGSQPL